MATEGTIPDAAKNDAYAAADKVEKFFAANLGMSLDRDVRILIVPNRDAYIQANIRENKVTLQEAERRAKTTRAWSQGSLIIQNVGDATLNSSSERVFNIAHELVHQYQSQVSGGRHTRMEWLAEGAADAIAAKILEIEKLQTLAEYRAKRISVIKKAKKYPSVAELELAKNWYAALDKYGSRVTYRVADIAVLELLNNFDHKDLFAYFAAVKTTDPKEAFEAVFKKPIAGFFAEADEVIRAEIQK
ncbi:MAG TPA: hypothetical protein VN521_07920 [Negativicutes bacterium]|nr:hypothetical protein [Negativicutes bacterium]